MSPGLIGGFFFIFSPISLCSAIANLETISFTLPPPLFSPFSLLAWSLLGVSRSLSWSWLLLPATPLLEDRLPTSLWWVMGGLGVDLVNLHWRSWNVVRRRGTKSSPHLLGNMSLPGSDRHFLKILEPVSVFLCVFGSSSGNWIIVQSVWSWECFMEPLVLWPGQSFVVFLAATVPDSGFSRFLFTVDRLGRHCVR